MYLCLPKCPSLENKDLHLLDSTHRPKGVEVGVRVRPRGTEVGVRVRPRGVEVGVRVRPRGGEVGVRVRPRGTEVGVRVRPKGVEVGVRVRPRGAEVGVRVSSTHSQERVWHACFSSQIPHSASKLDVSTKRMVSSDMVKIF